MDYYVLAEKKLREGRKTKSFEAYKETQEYQIKLRGAVEGKSPLEWELVHWHKALNYYDKPDPSSDCDPGGY